MNAREEGTFGVKDIRVFRRLCSQEVEAKKLNNSWDKGWCG